VLAAGTKGKGKRWAGSQSGPACCAQLGNAGCGNPSPRCSWPTARRRLAWQTGQHLGAQGRRVPEPQRRGLGSALQVILVVHIDHTKAGPVPLLPLKVAAGAGGQSMQAGWAHVPDNHQDWCAASL
jgi:hypothetical protein